MAPDQAILREASRGYDLVVVFGVSRRLGDMLFFGHCGGRPRTVADIDSLRRELVC